MSGNKEDIERGPDPANRVTIASVDDEEPYKTTIDRRPSLYISGMSDQTRTLLSEFRFHLGIHNPPDLDSTGKRLRPNLGIYPRVITAEEKYNKQFALFSLLINGALGFQIIIAAALTALGAGHGPHSAVTAFGAINTVIAGFLTFLKGSGLPNRLKYYANEWSKVREYIEQRERDFAGAHLDETTLREEIAIIERMYENVRKDVEANTPDSYVSMSQAGRSSGTDPPPSLARGLESAKRRMQADKRQVETNVEEKVHSTEDKLFSVAEKAAEKVLSLTQKHEHSIS